MTRTAALLVGAVLAGACASAPPLPERAPGPVAIISIDGLRADVVGPERTPRIAALARSGASTLHARTVVPSITLTSHASMLSGFPPSAHGLRWSDYLPERGFIRVPTLFAVAREAGRRTVMVVGKPELAHLNLPRSVDRFHRALGGDVEVVALALQEIAAGFDLLFVHLPDTDLAGHRAGWMSEEYLARATVADEAVGRIADALPADVTLIVTGDHGGHASTHGTNTDADRIVPWIITGPGIAPARILTARVRTMDTAATAAFVMGLRLDPRARGRVVREAFVPSPVSVARWRPGMLASAVRAED